MGIVMKMEISFVMIHLNIIGPIMCISVELILK